jgi:glycerate-2-kinase
LAVLDELGVMDEPSIEAIVCCLRHGGRDSYSTGNRSQLESDPVEKESRPRPPVTHLILANNATAVDATGVEAERLGYSHAMISATKPEGPAEEVGRHLAQMALGMRDDAGPDCLISGGEPTVTLIDDAHRGKGGRNQQLALAALMALGDCHGIALLSAGTDGEDGPTDAAGAFVTEDIAHAASRQQLDPQDYLTRNDAYHFFERTGGLFITGPTQTNVCDLRVLVVSRGRDASST